MDPITLSIVLIGLLVVLPAWFWVWTFLDCWKHELRGRRRWLWLLLIVAGGWPGALVYYLVRRPRRLEEQAQ